ncbi:hypothetical protein [Nocardia vinacea]
MVERLVSAELLTRQPNPQSRLRRGTRRWCGAG